MALITKTNTFSAGATIIASEHNANFDVIYNDYNGNITNANLSGSAAIADTKLAQITSASKVHTSAIVAGSDAQGDVYYRSGTATTRLGAGTDGQFLQTQGAAANPQWASVSVNKHYRKGLQLVQGSTADTDIVIQAGVMEIGGTAITTSGSSADIDITVAGNWTSGSGSVPFSSQECFVYAYNNSGVIGYYLSDETPDLSYNDDTTAEIPYRYQKYDSTYQRLVGSVFIDAAGDLCWGHTGSEGKYVSNFDASNTYIINGLGTGSDQTFTSNWTPKQVKVIYGFTDTTPASTDNIIIQEATQKMLDGAWYGTPLNARVVGGSIDWYIITEPGAVGGITTQSTSAAGSFTVAAMGSDELFYAIAWTDEL